MCLQCLLLPGRMFTPSGQALTLWMSALSLNMVLIFCIYSPISSWYKPLDKCAYSKIMFLFLNENICCGYSKEPAQWKVSFEHPKQMLKLMDMKIFSILRSIFFVYLDLCHMVLQMYFVYFRLLALLNFRSTAQSSGEISFLLIYIEESVDQEMPLSHTADQPTVPRRRGTEPQHNHESTMAQW